jgi:hypothetical protein
LSGPSLRLDPRVHAYRRDIADIALAGQLFAPHYARPMMLAVGPNASDLVGTPSADAQLVCRLQPGEEFAVLDISGGWAWGYRRKDHLVGFVAMDALTAPAASE